MPNDRPALTMRPARPADAPRCADIAVAAWQRVFANWRELLGERLWTQHFATWEANKRQQIVSHFTEYTTLAFVTEVEGVIAGFMTYRLHEDVGFGEISNNAVDPAYQGAGIGAAQCRHVLEIFREAGMRSARVVTGLDEGHAPARAMYEKVGFDRSIPHISYYMELAGEDGS